MKSKHLKTKSLFLWILVIAAIAGLFTIFKREATLQVYAKGETVPYILGSEENWLSYKDGPRTIFVRVLVHGRDTGNQMSVIEQKIPVGFTGPGLHKHVRCIQTIKVIEGKVVATFGEDQRQVVMEKGSFLYLPFDAPHDFKNPFLEEARIVSIQVPAGLENMFIEWHEIDKELDEKTYHARLREISDKYDNGLVTR